jgi:hypothetical protein
LLARAAIVSLTSTLWLAAGAPAAGQGLADEVDPELRRLLLAALICGDLSPPHADSVA